MIAPSRLQLRAKGRWRPIVSAYARTAGWTSAFYMPFDSCVSRVEDAQSDSQEPRTAGDEARVLARDGAASRGGRGASVCVFAIILQSSSVFALGSSFLAAALYRGTCTVHTEQASQSSR